MAAAQAAARNAPFMAFSPKIFLSYAPPRAPAHSTAQFDLLAIRSAKNHAAPVLLTRLSGIGLVRCPHQLDTACLQVRDGGVEAVGLQAEMESRHRSF